MNGLAMILLVDLYSIIYVNGNQIRSKHSVNCDLLCHPDEGLPDSCFKYCKDLKKNKEEKVSLVMIQRKISEGFCVLNFLILGYLTGLGNGGQYCVYLHEDYYTFNQKYCESGCCKDYGDDDEICCFSWSIGIIIGICFAVIGFIAFVAFLIICCYMMKKRSRNGHIINPMNQQTQNNTVVYTGPYSLASAGYSYPHPPSGYYPGSRFPGFGAPPPPYTAGTQPAYPPTQMNQSNNGPPLPSNLYSNFQTRQPSAPTPADNTTQMPYGGYGTGQS